MQHWELRFCQHHEQVEKQGKIRGLVPPESPQPPPRKADSEREKGIAVLGAELVREERELFRLSKVGHQASDNLEGGESRVIRPYMVIIAPKLRTTWREEGEKQRGQRKAARQSLSC